MLICDTAPLVAAADRADPAYQRCRTLLESHPGPLVTTALFIAEAGWLIRRQLDPGAEAVLYQTIAQGQLTVETLTSTDWARISELVDYYSDIGLDAADASIIAIAERLNQTTTATLDERDFRIVWPAHVDAFELLPRAQLIHIPRHLPKRELRVHTNTPRCPPTSWDPETNSDRGLDALAVIPGAYITDYVTDAVRWLWPF